MLWCAARDVGFFTVINHGIDKAVIDAVFSASAAFFSQDIARKESQAPFAPKLNSGYEFMTQVRPSTGTADQKESLQMTARQGCMNGRWPELGDNVEFRPVMERAFVAAHALSCRLLSLLEPLACAHLPRGTLASGHNLWGAHGQCTLRLLHYPPIEATALRGLGNSHWRAGPHTDWDCLTLLFQRPGQPGLECRSNPRSSSSSSSDQWQSVPPLAGGIAVNVGDMLSRWSGGRVFR